MCGPSTRESRIPNSITVYSRIDIMLVIIFGEWLGALRFGVSIL